MINAAANPVLRWIANNVTLETNRADIWKPSKKKSTERIDGLVAAIMAVGLAILEQPRWGIYYDSHPLELS